MAVSQEKSTRMRYAYTHSQFVLFSCAIVSEVISSISSRENPFMFCKIAASTTKHEKSILWNNAKEHEKPLHTLRISHIFMLRMCFVAVV